MKSVNGGEYLPNTNSGPIHQALTATAAGSSSQPCLRHRITRPAGVQAASVAVALTAPISAMGMVAAAISRPVILSVRSSGTSTQGASMTGQASEEIAVSVVSVRGDSANSSAAMM